MRMAEDRSARRRLVGELTVTTIAIPILWLLMSPSSVGIVAQVLLVVYAGAMMTGIVLLAHHIGPKEMARGEEGSL